LDVLHGGHKNKYIAILDQQHFIFFFNWNFFHLVIKNLDLEVLCGKKY
jgi:hypothetical protein